MQRTGDKEKGEVDSPFLFLVEKHDSAARIYNNSQPLIINFSVSKYPSETLGQFLIRLRLEKGLE
jgi:hypothetical protein